MRTGRPVRSPKSEPVLPPELTALEISRQILNGISTNSAELKVRIAHAYAVVAMVEAFEKLGSTVQELER